MVLMNSVHSWQDDKSKALCSYVVNVRYLEMDKHFESDVFLKKSHGKNARTLLMCLRRRKIALYRPY